MTKNKLILTLALSYICLVATNAMSLDLPVECKQILDKKYSGWKMATISKDVSDYFLKEKMADSPNLVKGDWNGDGNADYAVLINYGTEKIEGKSMPMSWTIAFIKNATGYTSYKLEGGDYIQTVKKGKKGFDHDTKKPLTYKTDAILSAIWEKSGTSYVWEKGKFKSIITSD
jgi:hypothetical protein